MKFSISNYQFSKLLIAIALFLFLTTADVQAALVTCGITANDPCQFCDIFVLLNDIIQYFMVQILPIVALALVVWGGFRMLTSGDNQKGFEEAKKIITATVVGIVIILTSWLLLNTIFTAIGIAEWTGLGSWWQIQCP